MRLRFLWARVIDAVSPNARLDIGVQRSTLDETSTSLPTRAEDGAADEAPLFDELVDEGLA